MEATDGKSPFSRARQPRAVGAYDDSGASPRVVTDGNLLARASRRLVIAYLERLRHGRIVLQGG